MKRRQMEILELKHAITEIKISINGLKIEWEGTETVNLKLEQQRLSHLNNRKKNTWGNKMNRASRTGDIMKKS